MRFKNLYCNYTEILSHREKLLPRYGQNLRTYRILLKLVCTLDSVHTTEDRQANINLRITIATSIFSTKHITLSITYEVRTT